MQFIFLSLLVLLAGCSWLSGQPSSVPHASPPTPVPVVESGVAPSSHRADDYMAIQRKLVADGDYSGPIDGKYGPATEAAVRKYQASHDLTVNGRADADTLAKMGL